MDIDEQEKLISDAGAANTVFLRNHGIITMGESIGKDLSCLCLVPFPAAVAVAR